MNLVLLQTTWILLKEFIRRLKMALNAKELIKKRDLINQKKNKEIEIEVPDTGTFLFRLPTLEDYEDSEAYAKSRKKQILANNYLIHACCIEPNLRDEELLKEFECKEPVEIVDKIFMIGEITSIADTLVKKAGFDKDNIEVVDKIKN